MKNYNELVSVLREVARDMLRTKWINKVRTDLLQMNNTIQQKLDAIKKVEKNIEILNYELTKLDELHPSFEAKKADKIEDIESYTKILESMQKQLEDLKKEAELIQNHINDIQEGKEKVNSCDLEATTAELIKAKFVEVARNTDLAMVETD